eukprot:512588-Hanusia_phi.AAC.1
MSSAVLVSARARRGENRHLDDTSAREVEITRQVIQDLIHMRQVDAATALVRPTACLYPASSSMPGA